MPSNESPIEILVADDTLDDELGVDAKDIEQKLAKELAPISEDVDLRRLSVTFIKDKAKLRDAVQSKRWDFIALDNKWLPSNEEFGFNLAKELRKTEGLNRETPLCIFTNQNWLREPKNINQVYKLDERLGDVGSFADFFPKAEKPPPGNAELWLEFFATELLVRMKACFRLRSLNQRVHKLDDALIAECGLIGSSTAFKAMLKNCQKFAKTDDNVLITGENGTGKELVAKAIFRLSDRNNKPYLAINCAAIPEHLLESELFGHERGAFTGAIIQRIGKFEEFTDGTIFLDEIGEMLPPMQAKLLRVLQHHTFQRVGGNKEIEVNTRVVAATNKNLEEAVRQKQFREDLFYRFALRVHVPSLRERNGDIKPLAEYFLNIYRNKNMQVIVSRLGSDALQKIEKHDWPGNVRELEYSIKRAVLMAETSEISADLITFGMDSPSVTISNECVRKADESLEECLIRIERAVIQNAMNENNGDQSRAAATLKMSPSTLHGRRVSLGIHSKQPKS